MCGIVGAFHRDAGVLRGLLEGLRVLEYRGYDSVGVGLVQNGSIVVRTKPQDLGRAVKAETAKEVAEMMQEAVVGGTGTAAKISGLTVGGKTGTAETGLAGLNTTWFISYAGRKQPEVAIAVVVEQQNSTGGATAAPVARDVLQALLPTAANS